MNLQDIRNEYKKGKLNKSSVFANPIDQFNNWLKDALSHCSTEPTAMTLSTADKDGQPDARIVLLKDVNYDGFTFFTNYNSHKGKELESNPKAALSFFWPELERQVRILGSVTKVSEEASEAYFNSRPEGSQMGAIISDQSSAVENREVLVEKFNLLKKQPENIKRPKHWGGYILSAFKIEFWQGGEFRIHDRIQYELIDGNWVIVRLAP